MPRKLNIILCDGIQIWDSDGGIIRNNFIKNWGHSSIQMLSDDKTEFIENIKVYQNTITAPDIAYGGQIGLSMQSRNCEIYNNLCINGPSYISVNGYQNHFHHNIFKNTRTSPIKPWQTGLEFISKAQIFMDGFQKWEVI